MHTDIKEAFDAVEEFNDKVLEVIGDETEFSSDHLMTLESEGTAVIIKFMGVRLWFSDEDDREFDEEKDVYEPLPQFLEKRARQQLAMFERVMTKI